MHKQDAVNAHASQHQATVRNHAYAIINTQPVLPLCLQDPQHH